MGLEQLELAETGIISKELIQNARILERETRTLIELRQSETEPWKYIVGINAPVHRRKYDNIYAPREPLVTDVIDLGQNAPVSDWAVIETKGNGGKPFTLESGTKAQRITIAISPD